MDELEKKILSGERLTEEELLDTVFGFPQEKELYHGSGRWNDHIETIIKVGDKLFSIDWERGSTEMQENFFHSQPVEVVRKERTVVETYYEPSCYEQS